MKKYFKTKRKCDIYLLLFSGARRVEEEFQRLSRSVVPPANFKGANMNCNKQKNRYANVLPYDDSRVKLSLIAGVEGSDYINANYIDGYMKNKAFIATQAPISDTISDFWRMIWQESSLTIVMLSNEMESGRVSLEIIFVYSGMSLRNAQTLMKDTRKYFKLDVKVPTLNTLNRVKLLFKSLIIHTSFHFILSDPSSQILA